jgi:hypothetical protein
MGVFAPQAQHSTAFPCSGTASNDPHVWQKLTFFDSLSKTERQVLDIVKGKGI